MRHRRAQETNQFAAIVKDHRALQAEAATLRTKLATVENEAEHLRRDAEDVLGRKDAAALAARLESRVLELQKEAGRAAAAQALGASATEMACIEATEARARLTKADAALDAKGAAVAAHTARVAELEASMERTRASTEREKRAKEAANEESRLLRAQNDDLVLRLVDEKQRLVTEMNAMNAMIDRLKRENGLLRQDATRSPGVCVPDGTRRVLQHDDAENNTLSSTSSSSSSKQTTRTTTTRTDEDDESQIWDVVGSFASEHKFSPRVLARVDTAEEARDCVFDASGRAVYAASSDGRVRRFDVASTSETPRWTVSSKRDAAACFFAAC